MQQRWPERIWIVRHGESAGNVARDRANADGLARIDIQGRDVDVALSQAGHGQSEAVGRWFASLPAESRPDVVLVSPYQRARQTADTIVSMGGVTADAGSPLIDERLREKEFGMLDRLTHAGIQELFPEQTEFRNILGKFYYRPPSGESWCDVILRLRSALDTIALHYSGRRVLIVGHQVVVLCMRYLLENMSEEQILAVDREGDVANCSVTEYQQIPESENAELALVRYNFVAPIEQAGEAVTTKPDEKVGLR